MPSPSPRPPLTLKTHVDDNVAIGANDGGLANIVEKAMGSVVKAGSAPISGVLLPGEKVKQRGLIYAAAPASDIICGTLQLAAGMNLHVFTTGRKKTWAEHWKLHNAQVLINPAPVT